jgi:hypothetical protein
MKALIVLLLFLGASASCQSTDGVQNITLQDLELQFKTIQEFVDKNNCSENSQCNYIAYGSKACGGPQGYLVYSSEINLDKLKALVTKYSKDEDSYNKQNGIVSDCSTPSPPEQFSCIDGKCVGIE